MKYVKGMDLSTLIELEKLGANIMIRVKKPIFWKL